MTSAEGISTGDGVDDVAVQAAGGVVLRRGAEGTEVLVVHRPKYDDWSLPKGKLDDGETHEECALREVEEETGYRCRLGGELPGTSYTHRKGRPKVVRYWEMVVEGGEFVPCQEVDAIRWLTLAEAADLLTYERDRVVLSAVDGLH